MTIKGAIFDMDGLMIDTERLMMKAWRRAGEQLGFPIGEAVVKRTLGLNAENTKKVFAEVFAREEDFLACRQVRNQLLAQDIEANGLPVKAGLYQLLDFLKAGGYKIAVATSTARERATGYLKKVAVDGYFDAIICGDMIARGKPEPDIYLAAAGALGLAPQHCIALEDSPVGVLSAYRAGCRPIMVPDLIVPSPETRALLYAQVSSLDEVIPLLEGE